MFKFLENIIISCKNFLVQKKGDIYNKESFLPKYQKCKTSSGRKILGEGGNAIVFYVQDVKTKEYYALKFLKTLKKEKIVRFLEE